MEGPRCVHMYTCACTRQGETGTQCAVKMRQYVLQRFRSMLLDLIKVQALRDQGYFLSYSVEHGARVKNRAAKEEGAA